MTSLFTPRRRIQAGLVAAGAAGGSIIGAALTVFGKIVTGAPPATAANYVWNMVAFGLIGAVVGPIVTWSALRHVPLWKTVTMPLLGGICGAAIGVLLASPVLFLILTPVGIAAATLRLGYTRRDDARLPREPR